MAAGFEPGWPSRFHQRTAEKPDHKDKSDPPFAGQNEPRKPIKEPVGSNSKSLAKSLGLSDATSGCGCGCNALAAEMNRLWIEGCQRERERQIEKLRTHAGKVPWFARVAIPCGQEVLLNAQ